VGSNNRRKEKLCILFEKQSCFIAWPKTCMKTINQCLFLDSRCAFPCDKEVPIICMLLPFCSICANFGMKCACCASINTLVGANPNSS
jgi:hypothetical protein